MVIDTSALTAIFLGEPEADRFDEAIARAKTRLLPATCLLEARIVLVARRDVIPVDSDLVDLATQAWLTYGKGRHPAALNFADCLSYALAKRSGLPLLFKGDDFSRTDVRKA